VEINNNFLKIDPFYLFTLTSSNQSSADIVISPRGCETKNINTGVFAELLL